MGLRDLEKAVDRLENVLCAEEIPAHVRREIDRFVSHVAAELVESMEREESRRDLLDVVSRLSAN